MNPPTLVKDDRVELQYGGRTFTGEVAIASPSSLSIGIYIDDGIVWPSGSEIGAGFMGFIPFMWENDTYIDLIYKEPAVIKKI